MSNQYLDKEGFDRTLLTLNQLKSTVINIDHIIRDGKGSSSSVHEIDIEEVMRLFKYAAYNQASHYEPNVEIEENSETDIAPQSDEEMGYGVVINGQYIPHKYVFEANVPMMCWDKTIHNAPTDDMTSTELVTVQFDCSLSLQEPEISLRELSGIFESGVELEGEQIAFVCNPVDNTIMRFTGRVYDNIITATIYIPTEELDNPNYAYIKLNGFPLDSGYRGLVLTQELLTNNMWETAASGGAIEYINDISVPWVFYDSETYANYVNFKNYETDQGHWTWYIRDILVSEPIQLYSNTKFRPGTILRFQAGSKFVNPQYSSTNPDDTSITLDLTDVEIDAPLQEIFAPGIKIVGMMKNDSIPVEWFGAKGDGVTDDAAAINRAIQFAGDKEVLLSSANYFVNSTIRFSGANTNPATLSALANTRSTIGNVYSWQGKQASDEEWHKKLRVIGNIIGGSDVAVEGSLCGVLNISAYQAYVRIEGAIIPSNNAPAVTHVGKLNNIYIKSLIKDSIHLANRSGDGTNQLAKSGVGFAFKTGQNNYIHIGSIDGFEKGFYASDKYMNAYGTYMSGMGNTIDIDYIDCYFPFYFERKHKSASFFNGNVINYNGCPPTVTAGAAITMPKYSSSDGNSAETFFTVDWIMDYTSKHTDGFSSNVFNFNYIQGYYWKLFDIEAVHRCVFNLNGNFLSDVQIAPAGTAVRTVDYFASQKSSITTTSTTANIFHKKLHPTDTTDARGDNYKQSIFNIAHCQDCQFNTMNGYAFPIDAVQVYCSTNIEFNGACQPSEYIASRYGLFNPNYFYFDGCVWVAVNGSNGSTSTIAPTTDIPLFIIPPKYAQKIVFQTGTTDGGTMYGTAPADTIWLNTKPMYNFAAAHQLKIGYPNSDSNQGGALKFVNPTHPYFAASGSPRIHALDKYGVYNMYNAITNQALNTVATAALNDINDTLSQI